MPASSISSGLDYAGIGPKLALHGDTGRIEFINAKDEEVLNAFRFFALKESTAPERGTADLYTTTIRSDKK